MGKIKQLRTSRLGWTLWRWRAIMRYCFTGKCGLACGMVPFHKVDGTPVELFVPEADCPIHDNSGMAAWLLVADWLRCLFSSVRGFCESMWWDLPLDWDEQVQEAVESEKC